MPTRSSLYQDRLAKQALKVTTAAKVVETTAARNTAIADDNAAAATFGTADAAFDATLQAGELDGPFADGSLWTVIDGQPKGFVPRSPDTELDPPPPVPAPEPAPVS